MKRKILFFSIAVLFASCAFKRNADNKIATAQRFVKYINMNDDKAAYALLDSDLYNFKWKFIVKSDINRAHDLFEKYGTPSQRKWEILYDTLRGIRKLENIIIPIHKGYDESNHLEEAYIRLGFDYTGKYLPDTVIAEYELYTNYNN
ncbi:MAG: hypothetical protein JST70_13050 [Bacteroidetes bacterium]|nr:hypothetical protein [Bacteroidota bacterium]